MSFRSRSHRCASAWTDIPVLVEYLIERYAKKAGKSIRTIKKQTVEAVSSLRLAGERARAAERDRAGVVLCDGETFAIDQSWLQGKPSQPSRAHATAGDHARPREKELIEAALAASSGRISGLWERRRSSASRARRSSRK